MTDEETHYERKILLGREVQTSQEIFLYPDKFALGGYFIGIRRVGKSTLLENFIAQDIRQRQVGVCVIDPHGDLITNVINRMSQPHLEYAILLDPLDADGAFPFGLNIFKCENKNNPRLLQYTVDSVMHLFEKLFPAETVQPMVEDVLRVSAHTIIANDMTMVEIPKLILDRTFRSQLLRNVRNTDVLDFWETFDRLNRDEQERQGGTIARRVRKFTTNEIIKYIVGQAEKSLNFRSILDESENPKVVLVRLHAEMAELTSLIGSMIIGQLLQAALSRSSTARRPEFHLYCDEYSRFATSDFSTIISEAGKYKIIPFIAHQSQGQISIENQDSAIQLGNLFCFRVIGRDAERLANEFDTTPTPATKPPPTIPSNVLEHLYRHPDEQVKWFWNQYIQRWQDAVRKEKKERVRTITEWQVLGQMQYEEKIITWPEHELGEGMTPYNPADVVEALFLINTLLYDVQTKEVVNQEQKRELLRRVASFLDFVEYYDFLYLSDAAFFDAHSKPVSQTYGGFLEEDQDVLNQLKAFRASDIDIMRFHLFRGKSLYIQRFSYSYIAHKNDFNNKESSKDDRRIFPRKLREYKAIPEDEAKHSFLQLADEYTVLAKRHQSPQAYVSWMREGHRKAVEERAGDLHRYTFENWKKDRRNLYETSRSQRHVSESDYRKDYERKMQEWISFSGGQISLHGTLAEWLEALTSNEAFVSFMAIEGHLNYFELPYRSSLDYPGERQKQFTVEELWAEFTKECSYFYACYSLRDTPEKLLAETRHELEQEIAEFENKTQSSQKMYDEKIAEVQQELDRKKADQREQHDRFRNALDTVLAILRTDEGKIPVPSTQWQERLLPHPSFGEKTKEIANTLVHLPRFTAMIKIPDGELIIKITGSPKPNPKHLQIKLDRILSQTRRSYCKPRAEVEREIAARIQPQLPTQRKHTI